MPSTSATRQPEALVKHLVASEDRDTLEELYSRLPEWVEDAATSALLRVLTQQARKTED